MKRTYDDIIGLSRPVSSDRPKMPTTDRAAQFAPFKALVGLEGALDETARQTDDRLERSEAEEAELNRVLNEVKDRLSELPEAYIVRFIEDGKKAGGAYRRERVQIKGIDEAGKAIRTSDGREIFLCDVYGIRLING